MFPDLQGRLVGKRVTAHYFRDHVDGDGVHMCNYLLAVDVDMTPVPGYTFANWDEGYGDVKAVPDMATLRTIPWLENTALVMCDLVDEDAARRSRCRPARILKHQIERAAAAGFAVKIGAELEFFLFKDSYEAAKAKRYHDLTPHSDWIEDYHILQTTRDEYLIRQIRNGMDGAGVPVEFSKGEAGRGQHEINLEYADALEMADRHAIYKNGAKEIAALNDRSITFMAKSSMGEVGLVLSPALEHCGPPTARVPMCDEAGPTTRRVPAGSAACSMRRRELAWLLRPERQLVQALPAGFVGTDGAGVGRGQPHLRRSGMVGQGAGLPRRVADPRRRREPVPGVRGDDRGRPARHRARARPRDRRSWATPTSPTGRGSSAVDTRRSDR